MPNRPETLNALNVDLLQRLSCVLDEIKTNQCVKAAVIAGSGTVFSAGADVHFLSRAMPLGVRELACLAVLVNKTTKPCFRKLFMLITASRPQDASHSYSTSKIEDLMRKAASASVN